MRSDSPSRPSLPRGETPGRWSARQGHRSLPRWACRKPAADRLDGRRDDLVAWPPDKADHHDDVVLGNLTSLALGDARQVDHDDVDHYAPTFGRHEHFPGRDGGYPSFEAEDRLRLSFSGRRREERRDGHNH